MTDYPNLCEVCNIGQLQFVTKSTTGKQFTLLKCYNCDSMLRYQDGLLTISSKGIVYTLPSRSK